MTANKCPHFDESFLFLFFLLVTLQVRGEHHGCRPGHLPVREGGPRRGQGPVPCPPLPGESGRGHLRHGHDLHLRGGHGLHGVRGICPGPSPVRGGGGWGRQYDPISKCTYLYTKGKHVLSSYINHSEMPFWCMYI